MFKDFFVEERRIWSCKKRKRVFLDFLKTFLLKKEGIEVLNTEKIFFIDV